MKGVIGGRGARGNQGKRGSGGWAGAVSAPALSSPKSKNMYLLIIFYNYSKMEFKLYSLIPFPLLNYSSY